MIARIALALLVASGCNKDAPNSENTAATKAADATPSSADAQAGAAKETDMSKHEQAYEKLVGDKAHPEFATQEKTQHNFADWRFFLQKHTSRRGPGMFRNHAAVDGAGHAVSPQLGGGDWHALLTSEGLEAAAALDKIAFLYRSIPFSPGDAGPPPKPEIQKVLTAPKLETGEGGSAVFEGWMSTPPNVDDPVRVRIEAPASGDPKITFTPWAEAEPAK